MIGKRFSWVRFLTALLVIFLNLGATVGSGSVSLQTGASGVDLDTFYDNFNDNVIDTNLWVKGSLDTNDLQVAVAETGGQLVITPRAGQSGSHYNGLLSSRTYNLTQGIIFVEVVAATSGSAQTKLSFGPTAANRVVMNTENGRLYMSLSINGALTGSTNIAYSAATHRWWRIRHVASGDTIRFDTSPDGITWTQRHSIARGSLNLTTGKVNLSAGTYNSQTTPGTAIFNNLSWHPLVPNKGDWSSPSTVLSPNPTAGTWDHILWGAASPSTVVKFNGKYYLYYIGAAGDNGAPQYEAVRRSLGVATSSDGINFTKYARNPILTYTTTSGAATQEGIGSATAIVVGNTIHMYYGAIRAIGNGLVDLDVRYRKSTDGFTFTDDTLIYRSSGNEYSPLGVTYIGGTWSVYMKGPLTDGKGALWRLSGTTPTSLPNRTSVTSTTFGSGGNANFISSNIFVVHLDRRQPTEDRFHVRSISTTSPNVISEPLFSYTFGTYGDHANPCTFKDPATGKWFMYTLNLSVEPAVISVRTYTPPTQSNTATPVSSVTATRTPISNITATATATRKPLSAAAVTTPTETATPDLTIPMDANSANIHVGDLDGLAETLDGNWKVQVTIHVHDNKHNLVANAIVTGTFSDGYGGTGSCTTDASGSCNIISDLATAGSTAIVFTITDLSYSSLSYISNANHDPDGESNGTIITIQNP